MNDEIKNSAKTQDSGQGNPIADINQLRKFLVIVDDSEEMWKALHFAARRARHTNGELVLLYIQDTPEYSHWLGVEAIMEQEREEEANARLQEVAIQAQKEIGKPPELLIRIGDKAQAILKLLQEDKSISVLVLGANTKQEGSKYEGPGPILSYFMGRNSPALTVPITVIPGHLSFEEINFLS